MILYHGSNTKVDKVDFSKCRKYKDFGQGFYCTTIQKQAEFMAIRTTKRMKIGMPVVNVFELNESIFQDKNIRIKKFSNIPSEEWARFILNNRDISFKNMDSLECNVDNKYDLVIGPVADDDIVALLWQVKDSLSTVSEIVDKLKYKELTDQYSFHTEKALKYLKGV